MVYHKETNLIIEDLQLIDMPAVLGIKPLDWGDFLPAFHFYFRSKQCLSLKASIQNTLVGTGTLIIHENVAWFAHIMVHPDYRGQGIAKKITQTLINIGMKQVNSLLLLATKLGKPVYSSLGFNFIEEYNFYDKSSISLPLSKSIIPYQSRYKQLIFDLDEEITGEKRKKFLEPILFKSFLHCTQGKLNAVYFAGFGEGLILAKDSNAGNDMLTLHLLEAKPCAIPQSNIAAHAFLVSNGFIHNTDRYVCRMSYGEPLNWKPAHLFGRFGGNLG